MKQHPVCRIVFVTLWIIIASTLLLEREMKQIVSDWFICCSVLSSSEQEIQWVKLTDSPMEASGDVLWICHLICQLWKETQGERFYQHNQIFHPKIPSTDMYSQKQIIDKIESKFAGGRFILLK